MTNTMCLSLITAGGDNLVETVYVNLVQLVSMIVIITCRPLDRLTAHLERRFVQGNLPSVSGNHWCVDTVILSPLLVCAGYRGRHSSVNAGLSIGQVSVNGSISVGHVYVNAGLSIG